MSSNRQAHAIHVPHSSSPPSPSSLSVQLSLLRAFSPPYFSSLSSSSPRLPPSHSPRLAPLLATIAPSSPECQHPRDSTDQSLSEAHVCCLFIIFPAHVYLYIQDIPYSLFLFLSDYPFIPLPVLFCWLFLLSQRLCSKITVAGQDCSDCKKKKKERERPS